MKFVRFLIVGTTCFGLNLAVLYLGTDILGMHYLVSMLFSILAVTTLGWLLNRTVTFRSTDPRRGAQATRYTITNLASMGIGLLLMLVLVDFLQINYLVSSAIIAIGMALANFLAHSRWTFRNSSQESRS